MDSLSSCRGIPYMQPTKKNKGRFAKPSPKLKTPIAKKQNGAGAPMKAPAVAYSQQMGTQRPIMQSVASSSDLRINVRHKEFVADISGSVAYSASSYSINPGLSPLFPWLSGMASLFESYRFKRLVFHYRTSSSTATGGKVLLSVDWDAADATPDTKVGQLQERTKADDAAWANFSLICDQADLNKFGPQRFVRQGSVSSTDIKTYDVGNLILGVSGMSGTSVVGELWVEYDVELMTPNTAPAPLSAKVVAATSISNAQIFGSAPVTTGSLAVTPSVSTLTFNRVGTYVVDYGFTGTLSAMTFTTGTATVTNAFSVVSGSNASWSLIVKVLSIGQTVIASSPTGTVTACVCRVGLYDYSLGI